mmetsp:Transcript_4616/g.9986  ORF Transcript_4616/g.9986 Transcript_4616/m.9986 type:complete len:84 (+) Transcript_4616:119-370(+)|eukprot:CAMPEP_0202906810 /NCGR_PEP_ID=MMETSP1392-20130828/40375_1 /ASSEMBLY_ACC=CAM_ASM_000868 /TAXON_ID=225041 /ORGANISM="Chlamydomonas chlamydogama, Strain SAG 11-48b" /LENGTH=83 /DNA_ID=CAMNT_0049595467 /DNA_START=81 /DNA_END=332 /DNA_ORIENTATION=+
MRIKLLFFAKSREVVGKSEEDINVEEGATTVELRAKLIAKYPGLESVMKTCVFALNQEYVPQSEAAPLKEGDEVAVIPPLSGG